ncbi:MAG: hypothetical protein FJ110_01255 [Deltaproteobacteria bacterium]|nr:hypothetical protein [Deltaproteobacteria bacterium]
MSILLLSCFVTARGTSPQERQTFRQEQAIEEYEREKLAKIKQNIGRRYLVVQTGRPAEFYRHPEEGSRRFTIQKEREGFLITEVVQNQLGTMNFYHVVFDSGQSGYLSADGNYLGIKILEGSIIHVPRTGKRGKDPGSPKASSLKAVELVKNHLIKMNPMSGGKMSVELRMVEARAKSFPNLKWRYEATGIDHNRARVIQFTEGEESTPLLRTWIVDLSAQAVYPENRTAQTLYQ